MIFRPTSVRLSRRLAGAALTFALFASLGPALAADPVQISSDKMVVDDSQHQATFTGKVVVVRADLTLWAPNVVVLYGEAGPSSIKSFVATGGVRIKTSDQDATGDRADYDPKGEMLKLTGNVIVVNATGSVGSPDLLIDLKTNKSVFTGKSGGRVSGVFTPK